MMGCPVPDQPADVPPGLHRATPQKSQAPPRQHEGSRTKMQRGPTVWAPRAALAASRQRFMIAVADGDRATYIDCFEPALRVALTYGRSAGSCAHSTFGSIVSYR